MAVYGCCLRPLARVWVVRGAGGIVRASVAVRPSVWLWVTTHLTCRAGRSLLWVCYMGYAMMALCVARAQRVPRRVAGAATCAARPRRAARARPRGRRTVRWTSDFVSSSKIISCFDTLCAIFCRTAYAGYGRRGAAAELLVNCQRRAGSRRQPAQGEATRHAHGARVGGARRAGEGGRVWRRVLARGGER